MKTVSKRRIKCYLCGRVKIPHDKSIGFHRFPKEGTTQRSLWYQFCGLFENVDKVSTTTFICSLHFNESDYVIPPSLCKTGYFKLKSEAVPSHLRPRKQEGGLSTYQNLSSSNQIKEIEESTHTPPVLQVMIRESDVTTMEASTSSCDPLRIVSEETSWNFEDTVVVKQENIQFPPSPSTPPREPPSESTLAPCNFAEPRYVQEIRTPHVSSPKRASRVLKLVRETDKRKSAKIRSLQASNRNLKKRVEILTEIVKELKAQLKTQKR